MGGFDNQAGKKVVTFGTWGKLSSLGFGKRVGGGLNVWNLGKPSHGLGSGSGWFGRWF